MRMHVRRFALSIVLLALPGCASTVATTVDGRDVAAVAMFPNHAAQAGSTPKEASINVGGRAFLVSISRVKWLDGGPPEIASSWHSVELPDGWERLRLVQEPDGVAVVVDGRKIATVSAAG